MAFRDQMVELPLLSKVHATIDARYLLLPIVEFFGGQARSAIIHQADPAIEQVNNHWTGIPAYSSGVKKFSAMDQSIDRRWLTDTIGHILCE